MTDFPTQASPDPTERDYVIEMAKRISDGIPDGTDYVSMEVATSIYEKVATEDPSLLQGWLEDQAIPTISAAVTSHRSYLARMAQRQKPTKFAAALAAYEDGDKEPLAVFQQTLPINNAHVVRRIGAMTKEDHIFVADFHHARALSSTFEAAFHTAIAARIAPGHTTEQDLTEVEYLQIRQDLTPQASPYVTPPGEVEDADGVAYGTVG
jgi:hypothetical protein